jgi:tRNA pseudouridine38-40 synthase
MRTIRLTVAYDGTDLHGWQYQPDLPTVQGLLMAACHRVLDAPVKVVGASRTDAGVHALRQVASLCTEASIEAAALERALNALLPAAVRVLDAREARPGFSARRSALGKRYAYLIDRGRAADPFLRRFAWHVPRPLDTRWLAVGLRALRGKRDFSAFCAAAGRGQSPMCTLRSTRVVTQGRWLLIAVSGDRFLHHMVRNVVGTLVEMGRDGARVSRLDEILESRDRRRAGPTAPAHGLALVRVLYGSEDA